MNSFSHLKSTCPVLGVCHIVRSVLTDMIRCLTPFPTLHSSHIRILWAISLHKIQKCSRVQWFVSLSQPESLLTDCNNLKPTLWCCRGLSWPCWSLSQTPQGGGGGGGANLYLCFPLQWYNVTANPQSAQQRRSFFHKSQLLTWTSN